MVESDVIRCDACPVLCYIKDGRTGACDRYANHGGQLVRLDPHVVLDRAVSRGESVVPFLEPSKDWDGSLVQSAEVFVPAIGAGTAWKRNPRVGSRPSPVRCSPIGIPAPSNALCTGRARTDVSSIL